ncbi:MAG TPA: hypothetical protein PKK29_11080, partial [Acetivibrio saccincola]|nr:hypothetical protein [Acetivibrio saccincola]
MIKLTDLAILFIIITIPATLLLNIKTKSIEIAVYRRIEINKMLEASVQDAVASMIEEGARGKDFKINVEKAKEGFLRSFYINNNTIEGSIDANVLKGYISCMVVVDYDGYYLISHEEKTDYDGMILIDLVCGSKKPYEYDDFSGLTYHFTLDNRLIITDGFLGTDSFLGTREEVLEFLNDNWIDPPEFLENEEEFNDFRRRIIISVLQKAVNDTINNHNYIARQYGISYFFSLPTVPDSDWHKTIDDIGLIVFFQGMPIGISGEKINSYALGSSGLIKKDIYILPVGWNR